MELNIDQARSVFEALPAGLQMPTLHPEYVAVDAQRNSTDLIPFFWWDTEEGCSLFHAGHVSNIPDTDFRDIQSAYGYGGPIWHGTKDVDLRSRLWHRYDLWCRQSSIVVEFLRFHPMLDSWRDFPGEVFFQRHAVAVNLTSNDLMSGYKTRVRTAIRKAQKKGLRIEWLEADSFMEAFPSLYHATMRDIEAADEYIFPEAYFRSLVDMQSACFAACMLEGELLAAAIFLVGPEYIEYHLSASTADGKRFGATNLLLHEAAMRGQYLGCKWLYLGGGSDNSEKNSLLFFKKGFSDVTCDFMIGRYCHLPEKYEELKTVFAKNFQQYPGRILFYR